MDGSGLGALGIDTGKAQGVLAIREQWHWKVRLSRDGGLPLDRICLAPYTVPW